MFPLKVVLAGAFYPNYFTWKISDEELSLRQMSGLDPTTTVMVRMLCGFICCVGIHQLCFLSTVVRVTATPPSVQSVVVSIVWNIRKRKSSSL